MLIFKFCYYKSGPFENRQSTSRYNELSPQYMKSNSRVSAQLLNSLANEKCPKNISRMRDKLVSLCFDEHKPMYFLNLDPQIAKIFASHGVEPLLKVKLVSF